MQELQSLIQQYDPQTERWSLFGELPFPLKGVYFRVFCVSSCNRVSSVTANENEFCSFTADASICALTVKLTDGGKEETDSIRDEYEEKLVLNFFSFELSNQTKVLW